jgi:glycosyltransferase involved in cell wall biosynthesis
MKILMLAHNVPYPLHDGYNLHNYQYAKQLGARHELHLIALGAGPPPPQLAGLFASIEVLPKRELPRPRSPFEKLAAASRPESLHDFDPRVFEAIETTLRGGGFDVVWVSGDKMLVYTRQLDLPVLGDVADDGARDAKSQLKQSRGPASLARRGLDYLKFHRYQRAVLPHVSVCNMVSEADRLSILASVPGLEVSVISNGVDAEFFRPQGAAKQPRSMVFEGSMDFPPNADAALYFCREILPLVLAAEPRARLTLVGKAPGPEVRALAGEGVEVTGFVDDVRPYLDRAEVFVSPLISGSGIKNKVLQAWAMELPVVATLISTGGLATVPGRNILLAEAPADFAAGVLRLFEDPELRSDLGRNARATVLEHSSWEAKAEAMERVLLRVKEKGRPPGRPSRPSPPANKGASIRG